jgi:hypothetical protein
VASLLALRETALRVRSDATPITPRQSNPTPPLTPGMRPARPIYCLPQIPYTCETLWKWSAFSRRGTRRSNSSSKSLECRTGPLTLPAGRPWSQSTVFHRFLIHRRIPGSGKSPRSEGTTKFFELLTALNRTRREPRSHASRTGPLTPGR